MNESSNGIENKLIYLINEFDATSVDNGGSLSDISMENTKNDLNSQSRKIGVVASDSISGGYCKQ